MRENRDSLFFRVRVYLSRFVGATLVVALARADNRDLPRATPLIPRHVAPVEHGMVWFETKRAPTFNAFPSRGARSQRAKVTVPFRESATPREGDSLFFQSCFSSS